MCVKLSPLAYNSTHPEHIQTSMRLRITEVCIDFTTDFCQQRRARPDFVCKVVREKERSDRFVEEQCVNYALFTSAEAGGRAG